MPLRQLDEFIEERTVRDKDKLVCPEESCYFLADFIGKGSVKPQALSEIGLVEQAQHRSVIVLGNNIQVGEPQELTIQIDFDVSITDVNPPPTVSHALHDLAFLQRPSYLAVSFWTQAEEQPKEKHDYGF